MSVVVEHAVVDILSKIKLRIKQTKRAPELLLSTGGKQSQPAHRSQAPQIRTYNSAESDDTPKATVSLNLSCSTILQRDVA